MAENEEYYIEEIDLPLAVKVLEVYCTLLIHIIVCDTYNYFEY